MITFILELSNFVTNNNILILEPLENKLNIKKIITGYLEKDSRKVTNGTTWTILFQNIIK